MSFSRENSVQLSEVELQQKTIDADENWARFDTTRKILCSPRHSAGGSVTGGNSRNSPRAANMNGNSPRNAGNSVNGNPTTIIMSGISPRGLVGNSPRFQSASPGRFANAKFNGHINMPTIRQATLKVEATPRLKPPSMFAVVVPQLQNVVSGTNGIVNAILPSMKLGDDCCKMVNSLGAARPAPKLDVKPLDITNIMNSVATNSLAGLQSPNSLAMNPFGNQLLSDSMNVGVLPSVFIGVNPVIASTIVTTESKAENATEKIAGLEAEKEEKQGGDETKEFAKSPRSVASDGLSAEVKDILSARYSPRESKNISKEPVKSEEAFESSEILSARSNLVSARSEQAFCAQRAYSAQRAFLASAYQASAASLASAAKLPSTDWSRFMPTLPNNVARTPTIPSISRMMSSKIMPAYLPQIVQTNSKMGVDTGLSNSIPTSGLLNVQIPNRTVRLQIGIPHFNAERTANANAQGEDNLITTSRLEILANNKEDATTEIASPNTMIVETAADETPADDCGKEGGKMDAIEYSQSHPIDSARNLQVTPEEDKTTSVVEAPEEAKTTNAVEAAAADDTKTAADVEAAEISSAAAVIEKNGSPKSDHSSQGTIDKVDRAKSNRCCGPSKRD